MRTFADLKANLKKDFSSLRHVRLAVATDSASQFLSTALRAAGYDAKLDLAVTDASTDQIEQAFLDPSSELWRSAPQYVLVLPWAEKLYRAFRRLPPGDRQSFSDRQRTRFEHFVQTAAQVSPNTRIILSSLPERDDAVYGSLAFRMPEAWLYQVRALNRHLADLASSRSNVVLHDLAGLIATHGHIAAIDERLAATASMALSLDFLPTYAESVVRLIAAREGFIKKCLILDLDNTLWGGVVGDDGLEGLELGDLGLGAPFVQLQAWAKMLKQRGIILAVASKNDEPVAKEPFEKHPEMVLRLDDIAVFSANWENKADNIRRIQSILDIGFDSMVFLDDNPAERELVRRELSDVCVPELPEDPAERLPYIQRLELFETPTITRDDGDRTMQYQQEAQRRSLLATFTNTDDFLRSLEMKATVAPFTSFNVPRVAQLTQRSNQFNLRTVRYTEDDIRRIGASPEHRGFAFSLTDSFGSYGLVSVVILRERGRALFVDTWLMSCRVLKRGLEDFVLDRLVTQARRDGFDEILGEYLPTKKNGLVKDHYASLGFVPCAAGEESAARWVLRVDAHKPRPFYITEISA